MKYFNKNEIEVTYFNIKVLTWCKDYFYVLIKQTVPCGNYTLIKKKLRYN